MHSFKESPILAQQLLNSVAHASRSKQHIAPRSYDFMNTAGDTKSGREAVQRAQISQNFGRTTLLSRAQDKSVRMCLMTAQTLQTAN
jgi:hypothetical protein